MAGRDRFSDSRALAALQQDTGGDEQGDRYVRPWLERRRRLGSSVNWPAPWRNAFVSYPSRPGETRTVFVHPTSGAVLGELPQGGFVRTVRDIHVYLLAGRTGLKVNGVDQLSPGCPSAAWSCGGIGW